MIRSNLTAQIRLPNEKGETSQYVTSIWRRLIMENQKGGRASVAAQTGVDVLILSSRMKGSDAFRKMNIVENDRYHHYC